MRKTCLLCVRKHLGKAEAQMNEVMQGYPHHAGLAIGNLSEAADECMMDYPELAQEIRVHWKAWELDEFGYAVPTTELLRRVEELLVVVRSQQQALHESHEPGASAPQWPSQPQGASLAGDRGSASVIRLGGSGEELAGSPSAMHASIPPRPPRAPAVKQNPPASESRDPRTEG